MVIQDAEAFLGSVCDILGVPKLSLTDGLVESGNGSAISVYKIDTRRGGGLCLITIYKGDRFTFQVNAGKGRQWEVVYPMGHKETDRILEILQNFFK